MPKEAEGPPDEKQKRIDNILNRDKKKQRVQNILDRDKKN